MKCCSPAEPPNYLYLKPSQPVGLETLPWLLFRPNQQMLSVNLQDNHQQPFLSDLPGEKREFHR